MKYGTDFTIEVPGSKPKPKRVYAAAKRYQNWHQTGVGVFSEYTLKLFLGDGGVFS